MRRILLLAGVTALAVAVVAAPGAARSAASRTWPPFVLVAGLLLIGAVAAEEGAFDRAARFTSRLGGGGAVLLLALLAVVAVVTALLNLDTAVAFLTPVLLLTARRRGVAEEPFVYGSLMMANAASLLLPGSNLTNLLVLGGRAHLGCHLRGPHVPGLAGGDRRHRRRDAVSRPKRPSSGRLGR